MNRSAILQRQGQQAPPPDMSELRGLEVAGTLVDSDFSGCHPFDLKSGDAMCALLVGGGYAEHAAALLEQCCPCRMASRRPLYARSVALKAAIARELHKQVCLLFA